jgi:chromosome segregation ATPase
MSVVVSTLQTELDKARQRQQDVEVFRQQLGDRQAECDRLGAQVRVLEAQVVEMAGLQTRLRDEEVESERLRVQLRTTESQQAEAESMRAECDRLGAQVRTLEVQVAEMAGLQARLEVSEASIRELDVVRGERDRWQAEAHNLQARLTADLANHEEQLGRLTADLQAAQAEGHQLQLEQQSCRHAAEQAGTRVSDLERALTEAAAAQATALDEARVRWELERQELEACLERERQSHDGAVQAAVREVQAQAAAERQQWRHRLEGAEQQIVWEREMFQEQSEQIRQQAAKLQAERDRLAARLVQAEVRLRASQQCSPDEAGHAAELHDLRQQAAREQVFVQLSGIRLGHLLPQTARAQHPDAPAEEAHPHAPLVRERASVEEQYRLTAIVQEVQAGWGEAAVGQEQPPAICNQSRRVEPQASEGEKAVEDRSAPFVPPSVPGNEEEASAPSDTPPSSAEPLEESQPAEDIQSYLPQQKDSRPESRQRLWRQIVGFVLGKK